RAGCPIGPFGSAGPPAACHSRPRNPVPSPTSRLSHFPSVALGLRQGLPGLQGVVDDDQVGTATGQDTADRGGDARALRGGLEFGYGLMARCEPGREEKLVSVAGENAPAIAREFVGEVLGVADAEDLRTRLVAEAPGRESDR